MSTPPSATNRRTYAVWYVWARRNLTSTVEICHACAQAASAAEVGGSDPATAARHAAQNRVGPGWTSRAPDGVRAYAEWYDWCRSHLGLSGEPVHAATEAAIASMDGGGDAGAAIKAAEEAARASAPGTEALQPAPARPSDLPTSSPDQPPAPAALAPAWRSAASQPPPPPATASPMQPPPPSTAGPPQATVVFPAPVSFAPGSASQPVARAGEGRVVVPLWVTVLLGVGCGISLLVAVIYAAVLTLTTDANVIASAWFLVIAGTIAFIASLAALVAVFRRGAWARVMAIVAGAVLCLTCVGILVGVPVIIGAAVARREA